MRIVEATEKGIEYLRGVLKKKQSVVTRAVFWRIPHKEEKKEDICLKIGRYKTAGIGVEMLESETPKSELTLDNEEFEKLIEFLQENYEPFKEGIKQYLPLENIRSADVEQIKAIFNRPDKRGLVDFIVKNEIVPTDLLHALELKERIAAVEEFEKTISQDLVEHDWQKWFKTNYWILGSEFVSVIDDRAIDTEHITDYIMKAYDGFLDVIEIKRPNAKLKFWADAQDHGNYVPSTDLVKAVTQSTKYVFELEREANSIKFMERTGGSKVVKPRCILIFGRSNEWNDGQKEAYRLLNASYHNILVLTYDHVLERARRILGLQTERDTVKIEKGAVEDLPF